MSTISKLLPLLKQRSIITIENRILYDSLKQSSVFKRNFAQAKRAEDANSLSRAKTQSELSSDVKPLGERVKENTKTATYLGVILIGAGVTAVMFYAIFRELFSSKSPNGVYSAALDKCTKDYRVEDALGAPIKAYGEETRRGRRGHVAHTTFTRDGVLHMRMMFHLQGIRNRAEAQLEVRENSSGNWDYRYLFVQLLDYPRTTIILEDNRATLDGPTPSQKLQGFL